MKLNRDEKSAKPKRLTGQLLARGMQTWLSQVGMFVL